ncbi:predicted MFS family arabinose efflux permease [Ureibacillus xyleni]|uniref:Predicted MFS family arabinose efflux permease n=1 Tax=Ureibacillus xyleni TaxID=614648 RepID=A0A285T4M0_9BACL|nr:MFS transporter [Ureibacillus xyleni]SOC15720.1 predicted MFS family arabinose efflux permease [Ureibacillus xyleni]
MATKDQAHPLWLQAYIDSPEKQQQLYKKTLFIVILSQIFGGAGLAAGITVGALIAQDMLGTDSVGGLPVALLTLGSAAAALIVGRMSQRFGRRFGLAAGFLTGGLGAIGVILATLINSILLFFLSLLLYGAGTATNLQARYAGTDLASAKQRGTAISMAMVFTTFGAVAGPNLVDVMGNFATSIGVPKLAGPFILGAAAFLIAGVILLIFLRPDPLLVAAAVAMEKEKNESNKGETTANNKKGVILGASVMVLTQFVMVTIMTMTPIHMEHHGHGLREVGLVIGFHIGAMYLPSLVTGPLIDKVGRKVMAIAAGVTLVLSACIAAFGPGDSMVFLILALILLGLGWNFGLISGTTLIIDSTHPSTRAKTQGSVDVWLALFGASGGAISGVIVGYSSYATLSIIGGILALIMIAVMIWSFKTHTNTV